MFSTGCHKMLHRARSLRKLRPVDQPSHRRQISISSDVSRASSSGSDTSGREHSVEWDPLRLHPSMEVDRSPHIEERPYHHGEETARHMAQQHLDHEQQFHPPRHTPPSYSLEIHDGFDFGFGSKPQHTVTPASHGGARRLRAPKSEADLRSHQQPQVRRPPMGLETASWGSAPSPTRRPHPAGFDEADHFIKRGGWKRRGIVFGYNEESHESEDDCFEIP